MKFTATKLLLLGLTVALAACEDTSAPTDQVAPPSFAAAKKTPLTGTPTERAAQIATKVNARLAAAGSKYRLSGASFFTTGRGVPAFRQNKFAGWADRDLTYMFDVSDYAPGSNAAAVRCVTGFGKSASCLPMAILAAMRAMGYPVAFDARAEERLTRGLTSMTEYAADNGSRAN